MTGLPLKAAFLVLLSLVTLPAASVPRQNVPLQSAPIAGWAWPLRPSPDQVVGEFDPPARPWLAGNRGVDLAGHAGEPVRAAGAGVVSFAGTIAGVGIVSVRSGELRTTYEPLRVTVRRGDVVASGAVLGRLTLLGSHCLPAACLHWGLLSGAGSDSVYLDPLALLGLEQVRLYPSD
jgi:murein DD-endopeptidase MepM/ murein hydrolase activator NlpD